MVRALLERQSFQRLARFAMSAAAVQTVYTAGMGLGLLVLDLPRQAVLIVAFLASLVVHFSLNRQWVFNPQRPVGEDEHHDYRLGLSRHGMRYLVAAAIVYAITAASLGVLPGLLGLAPFLVWLGTCAVIGVANYFLLGALVFR
jgi:putative flippase GtrA